MHGGFPAFAQTGFTIGVENGLSGRRVVLPVDFVNGDAAVGMQFNVVFDGAIFITDPVTAGAAADGLVVESSVPVAGTRSVLIYSSDNALVSSGVLVEVPFHIDSDTNDGSLVISLSDALVSDAAGNEIAPLGLTSGEIAVLKPPSLFEIVSSFAVEVSGNVTIDLVGVDGQQFRVEVSENLQTWTEVETGAGSTSSRFYRVVEDNVE
jgi:hypothetical protein